MKTRTLNCSMSADVVVDRGLRLAVRSNTTGEQTSVQLSRIRAQRLARALTAYALEERDAEPRTTIEARELPNRDSRARLRGYLHRSMAALV